MARRRFALYFSWSRPKEIGSDLGVLENRFPTLFEFRRAIWPMYEWANNPANHKQDISGFLDHVILFDFQRFNKVIIEATGNPILVIQREGNTPPVRELDEDFLKDIDTLIVVSLDHYKTEQRATQGEIEAVRHFLQRENACLIVCPHHDVGALSDQNSREVELLHHGDRMVPSQQRIGGFARSLLIALGIPIENQFGLNPARAKDGSPAPLEIRSDLDRLNILKGVQTFNLHPHLPHFQLSPSAKIPVHVLAKQQINKNSTRHPFTDAGNSYFNAFCWIPSGGSQAGNVFVCDATLWSAAFSGIESLTSLWKNFAAL
jgi:hypothetical protein